MSGARRWGRASLGARGACRAPAHAGRHHLAPSCNDLPPRRNTRVTSVSADSRFFEPAKGHIIYMHLRSLWVTASCLSVGALLATASLPACSSSDSGGSGTQANDGGNVVVVIDGSAQTCAPAPGAARATRLPCSAASMDRHSPSSLARRASAARTARAFRTRARTRVRTGPRRFARIPQERTTS